MKYKRGIVKIMKTHKVASLVIVALIVIGGVGTALAIQPNEPSKTVAQQSSATQSTEQLATPAADTSTVGQNAATLQEQPTTTTEPTQVTVAAYEQVAIQDSEDIDCKLTYSDGTTFQWHWKVVNGTTTNTSGYCDERIVGKAKADDTSNGWAENDPNWQSHIWDGVN